MTNRIVSIPWQPELKLRESTLALLVSASNRVGRRLYVRAPDGAWRSLIRQIKYWLAWLAGTGPVASNPYYGQRAHMRAAAFDLIETSATVQNACRAVGLIRDPVEDWHWNDPNWANIPVVFTLLQPAIDAIKNLIGKDTEMPANAKLFYDKTTRVGYLRDLDAAPPRIRCLGLVSQANYKIESNGNPGYALSTSQVAAQVEHHGMQPEDAEYLAWLTLPAGAVKPDTL